MITIIGYGFILLGLVDFGLANFAHYDIYAELDLPRNISKFTAFIAGGIGLLILKFSNEATVSKESIPESKVVIFSEECINKTLTTILKKEGEYFIFNINTNNNYYIQGHAEADGGIIIEVSGGENAVLNPQFLQELNKLGWKNDESDLAGNFVKKFKKIESLNRIVSDDIISAAKIFGLQLGQKVDLNES